MHTRWEHVATSCNQFLHRKDGFEKVALKVTNCEKTASQRNKVASESCSLICEPALMSMAYFLQGYHLSFWKPNFDWLKIKCPIAKVSGHASRLMSARTFIVSQHLTKLKTTWSVENEFKQFMVRKSMRDDKEQKMTHEDLPKLFLEDASCKFDKHFVKQWCGVDSMKFTIASIPQVSASFAK